MTVMPPPIPPEQPMPLAYAVYDPQATSDDSHLRLLVIFHYVWSGLTALIACVPVIHVIIGVLILRGKLGNTSGPNQVPPEVGYFFIGMGGLVIMLGWLAAIVNFLSAHGMRKRKWRLLSLIVAGLNCLSVPLGTALGVFALVVLLRPSVAAQYRRPLPASTREREPA